jgi:hypothetical protein
VDTIEKFGNEFPFRELSLVRDRAPGPLRRTLACACAILTAVTLALGNSPAVNPALGVAVAAEVRASANALLARADTLLARSSGLHAETRLHEELRRRIAKLAARVERVM